MPLAFVMFHSYNYRFLNQLIISIGSLYICFFILLVFVKIFLKQVNYAYYPGSQVSNSKPVNSLAEPDRHMQSRVDLTL